MFDFYLISFPKVYCHQFHGWLFQPEAPAAVWSEEHTLNQQSFSLLTLKKSGWKEIPVEFIFEHKSRRESPRISTVKLEKTKVNTVKHIIYKYLIFNWNDYCFSCSFVVAVLCGVLIPYILLGKEHEWMGWGNGIISNG